MDYQPMTAVWEITMGCNMRCMHCGSVCESALEDELTTKEALDLCDQIGALGLKWITLSGGEPFTRKDWPMLVKRLTDNGVMANMITNGWKLDHETLEKAKESGVSTIAVSVDGTRDIHDKIRKEGSFDRLSSAYELMHEKGITSGAVTTVSTKNIDILDDIMAFLIEKNVKFWQLQIGLPMGSMAVNSDMILEPSAVDRILDFIHKNGQNGQIKIYPADCLGYYTRKETEIRQIVFNSQVETHWDGCHAGKRSFGILQNGDILGCTSIRDDEFIEGSIRKRPLKEIWMDAESFTWSREMNKSKLKGHCKVCDFGDLCNGGCPNTRLTTKGTIYEENKYCSYNNALDKTLGLIEKVEDYDALYKKAEKYAQTGDLTLSYYVLESLLRRREDTRALCLMGFVAFMLGDYDRSLEVNKRAVELEPSNAYALKGLGLATYRIGKDVNKAIDILEKARSYDTTSDLDTYFDLANVYYEMGQFEKALEVVESGRSQSGAFLTNSLGLYNNLLLLRN